MKYSEQCSGAQSDVFQPLTHVTKDILASELNLKSNLHPSSLYNSYWCVLDIWIKHWEKQLWKPFTKNWRNKVSVVSARLLFRLLGVAEVVNMPPYAPYLQRKAREDQSKCLQLACLWPSQMVSTSAERASRRPAASSSVPRTWTQTGRYSQRDSKPCWLPYSHSGRTCSPLTTHKPRGFRRPVGAKQTAFMTSRDGVEPHNVRVWMSCCCYRWPWWPVWTEGCCWSCSSSGHLWRCGCRQTRTTPLQTPANPTETKVKHIWDPFEWRLILRTRSGS